MYALGLIHANRGEAASGQIITYLKNALNNAMSSNVQGGDQDVQDMMRIQSQVVQHGACLGLGLAAMGTANDEIFMLLREVALFDTSTCSDAAAIAMGLLVVGQVWNCHAIPFSCCLLNLFAGAGLE